MSIAKNFLNMDEFEKAGINTEEDNLKLTGNLACIFKRKGYHFHLCIYTGETLQVNIWKVNEHNMMSDCILQDNCNRTEDLKNMLGRLDFYIDNVMRSTTPKP